MPGGAQRNGQPMTASGQWTIEVDVLDDGGLVVCFDPQLPASTGTVVTGPIRARFAAAVAVALARRILVAHHKGQLPGALRAQLALAESDGADPGKPAVQP